MVSEWMELDLLCILCGGSGCSTELRIKDSPLPPGSSSWPKEASTAPASGAAANDRTTAVIPQPLDLPLGGTRSGSFLL